jgi:hypothetical protein
MAATFGQMALLTLARENKHAELARLVAAGAPVNAANEFGQAALHIACLWGNAQSVKTLLELGANVNAANSRGQTPLHFAANAKKDAFAVCQLLLAADADTEAVDMMGRLPYEMAADEDVRQLLGGPDARCEPFRRPHMNLFPQGRALRMSCATCQRSTPATLRHTRDASAPACAPAQHLRVREQR